ncbi:SLA class II histocompatibility antigen, DQ haplotype D beta chain-like [Polypterus senegalus]|uniref:SLA class II histocompatibility antigen, DQ haplotype D beta chain-like n=1 Tax=Polypterus senegalus TaxID=55291 RepID=UPI0019628A1C|nr:SLA class II histocompatibility antigen, DQ haplotype D beta chain-like [Polypterus senegalus]XP_039621144.1 SLA class II histocompatibility antigen, DQ haplotype D beta chain-like [Polypterus senegalus]
MRPDKRLQCRSTFFITCLALTSAAHHVITPVTLTLLFGQRAHFNCTLVEKGNCEEVNFYWRHKCLFQNGTEGDWNDIKNGEKHRIIYNKLWSSLEITDVIVSDEGWYMCYNFCFGKKTRLIEEKAKLILEAQPTVSATSSTSSEASDLLLLTCSAVGFYPISVSFTWLHSFPGGLHTSSEVIPTVLENGTYSSNSTLQISTAQWNSETEIKCVVNHSSLTKPHIEYFKQSGGLSSGVSRCQLKIILLSLGLMLMISAVTGVHVTTHRGNKSHQGKSFEEKTEES